MPASREGDASELHQQKRRQGDSHGRSGRRRDNEGGSGFSDEGPKEKVKSSAGACSSQTEGALPVTEEVGAGGPFF